MSRFNEGDRLQYIARRHNGVFGQRSLDERQEYVVENTSNLGVRINGVWYHEDLFELAPKPVPNPEFEDVSNKIANNSFIQVGPEGLRIEQSGTYAVTADLVSARVPPTVDEIRARWNVDYNYDMNMANKAPRDIRALLEQIDSLERERSEAVSEMERYQHESRDSAADNGRHIREKNEAVATLTAAEEAFYEAFSPDFVAWDWRDDDTIQTFANKFVHLLVAWKAKAKK